MSDNRICLGIVTGVHGVRGEVVIKSYTATPLDISAYGSLCDESGETRYRLGKARAVKKGVVVHIKGVNDRDSAFRLKGVKLFVERDRLPAPDEDEFYHTDLIGLSVLSDDGALLGRVVGVHDFGAGDLIEVQPVGADGERRESVLYPFTRQVVPAIDFSAATLTLRPPEEIEAPPDEGEAP